MSARVAARLAWSTWVLTLVVQGGGLLFLSLAGLGLLPGGNSASGSAVVRAGLLLTFGVVATVAVLIAARQPSNPIGWIMLGGALVASFDVFAGSYAVFSAAAAAPAGRLIGWLGPVLNVSVVLVPPLLLLFPNGRLPSWRWRPVLWVSAASGVLLVTTNALNPGRLPFAPGGIPAESAQAIMPVLERASQVALVLAIVLATASLVVRMRHARGDQRLQLRWIAYAAVVWAVGLAASILTPPSWQPVVRILYLLTLNGFVIAVGVAVLKYRLYDIDLVVNKTIVYAALALLITGVYVALVLGVGTAVSSRGEADLWLALVATVVVALAFQPARERAQRLANRLVYGQRATPYEVLADLSRRMAGALSVDEVLPRMAEAAAQGVGAARSRVRVYVPGGADRIVGWPQGAVSETFECTVLVLHQGTPAGELAVTKPPGEHLTRSEEKLLSDLAAQAGPALENVRLNLQLESRLEELQASRQRIVAAQGAERRRLERDLHDGAQQGLVALAVTARLARELVRTEPAEAESLMDEVSLQANEALGTLRDLARGIFPTALADRGLAAALEAHVAKVSPRPTFETDAVLGTRRFTPELEAGVYFCILEALQNCSKYAPDAPARVELASDDGWLVFSVSDQGPGFDQATTAPGSGLQNIADRLAALGGGVDVRSQLGAGTTVSGRLPMRASSAVDREGPSTTRTPPIALRMASSLRSPPREL